MRPTSPAYTLFELILVMAILVIVAALAYPSLDSMYGGYKVKAAADQVRAGWADARAHAMEEGRPYRFSVVPNRGNYRAAPDSGDFWSGSGELPAATDPNNPPLILEQALPKGVRFTMDRAGGPGDANGDSVTGAGSIDPTSWVPVVVFLPDGTARAPGSDDQEIKIVFNAQGARPIEMRLRTLTGVITVRDIWEGKP